MKHAALTFVLALLFAAPALAHDCDCVAPDGSCSASVSCPDGCYAMCGSQGNCSSGCAEGGPAGGPKHDDPSPLRSPLAFSGQASANLVTLNATDLTGQDVTDLLQDALGSDVRFLPVDPHQTYSIDLIEFPADQLTRALAEFGVVAVGGSPESASLGAAGARDAEVTIRLDETTMGVVVGLLDRLVAASGRSIQATDPSAPFNLEVQGMPLDELLAALEKMGAIQIE